MYKLDTKNKIVTIIAGTLTDDERNEIRDYKDFADYAVKVVKPRTWSGDTLKESEILKVLSKDKEALKKYQELKKQKGFFTAKSWYKKEYLKK